MSETDDLGPDDLLADDLVPVADDDPTWRRLHPMSLLVNLVPRAWAVVRQLWWVLLLALTQGRAGRDAWVDILFVGMFLVVALGNTVVHYLTLRYRLFDGKLEIRSGLLNRTKRVLAPARVQNVETVRNVFHRAAGLAEVRIETASGDEVEGLLSALTEDEANRLVRALKAGHRDAVVDTPDAELPVLAQNSPLDLAWYGATSTRFGAAAVGLGLLFEVLGVTDPEGVAEIAPWVGALAVVGVVAASIVGAWGIGIVQAVVRHHGFRLMRDGRGLVAEEGLFTRRRVELPLRKVQLVTIQEPALRRLVRIASVVVETASGRPAAGGTQRALSMVPVVAPDAVDALVREALPHLDRSIHDALRPPALVARRREVVRGVIGGTGLTLLLTWWWWPWAALTWPVWVAIAVALRWLDWKHQGWEVTDEVVVSRRGWLNRHTQIVARDKIQSVEVEQGPLLRRYRLGQVVVRVAGSAVAMPLLDHDEAFALASRLSRSVGRTRLAPASPAGPSTPAWT